MKCVINTQPKVGANANIFSLFLGSEIASETETGGLKLSN